MGRDDDEEEAGKEAKEEEEEEDADDDDNAEKEFSAGGTADTFLALLAADKDVLAASSSSLPLSDSLEEEDELPSCSSSVDVFVFAFLAPCLFRTRPFAFLPCALSPDRCRLLLSSPSSFSASRVTVAPSSPKMSVVPYRCGPCLALRSRLESFD